MRQKKIIKYAHGDINTIDYKKKKKNTRRTKKKKKKKKPVVLKHCNVAKEETLIHVRRHYEFQDFKKFLVKDGITKI